MRVAWRTVGSILTRVWSEVEAAHDRLANVRRIGIDEISYKRGHKYLTVVVDHDSGHLLWAVYRRGQWLQGSPHRFRTWQSSASVRPTPESNVYANRRKLTAVMANRCHR